MSEVDDLLADIRATDELAAAALEQADALLAVPEPDPTAVLTQREIPTTLPEELLVIRRDRRGAAHRRHRRKVAKVLEAKARSCRRAGQPLDAPDVA